LSSSTRVNDDGSTNVVAHSSILATAIDNYVGTGFDKKKLPKDIMLNSKEFLDGILTGVFLGDGATTKYGVKLQMTNPHLVEQLFNVANSLNIFASHREVITASGKVAGILDVFIKNKEEEEFTYKVSYKRHMIDEFLDKKKVNQYTVTVVDGYVLRKVKEIKKYPYHDTVYNLEVVDNHSYVAEGIVVHNCFIDTVDDSLDGIYNTNTDVATLSKYGGGIGRQ